MEIITTHVNADFDALASMIAAKKLYPDAVLAFSGSQEKGLRDFFVQSTIYVFEIKRLKSIDIERIRHLILVDTRQRSRIGKFAEIIGKADLDIHIYDHHPHSSDDISGSLEVIRQVGSTSTIFAQILKERGIEITPDEATVMALGVYEDTGSLTFSSTTVDDYMAAAYLLSKGADLNIVSDMIIKEFTAEDISLLNDIIQSATIHTINSVDFVITKASIGKYREDFAWLVHKLRDLKNINILFALARMGDRVHLVCRSRVNDVNVGEIATEFGGGGHSTAASASIKDLTMIQVEEKLLSILRNKIGIQRYAKDIMAFPVKVMESTESLRKAGELLTRYNINVLPVVKTSKLVGLISRQIIEKASFHGLQDLPTEEYMSRDFSVVSPDTPFSVVRKLIIRNNQRFLPVVENAKIVGAITRTEVLRVMQTDLLKKPAFPGIPNDNAQPVRMKSIIRLMEERLDRRILEILKGLGKKAEDLHYNVYIVGGAVRDIILRRENLDVDVVTEGDGIELARQFSKDRSCKVISHKKFGTATIIFPDNFKIDIATARLEYYESPAALPTVELSSIRQDLYRRDFTMNTLAIRLNPERFGELIDFFGAQKDIKDKLIRVIHNLSFVEDPTRIFRAIRFEQRFGFRTGKHTASLIKNAVKMNFIDNLDGRRFFSELTLIFQEEEPLSVIDRLAQFDILRFIHPKIRLNEKTRKVLGNIKKIISWFDLLFLGEKYEKWTVYFFGLIGFLSKQEVVEVCQRLSLTVINQHKIVEAIQQAKTVLEKFHKRDEREMSKIYNILKPLTTETLLYAMARTEMDDAKRAMSLYVTQLKRTEVILKGEDLKNLGIAPGRIFKIIFNHLLEARLDGMVETREDEIELVKENYPAPQHKFAISPDAKPV